MWRRVGGWRREAPGAVTASPYGVAVRTAGAGGPGPLPASLYGVAAYAQRPATASPYGVTISDPIPRFDY